VEKFERAEGHTYFILFELTPLSLKKNISHPVRGTPRVCKGDETFIWLRQVLAFIFLV
jgi:hypothetical protein